MYIRRDFAALSLVIFYALHGGLALPLDDTWVQGHTHPADSTAVCWDSSNTLSAVAGSGMDSGRTKSPT
jgi:hypothetical protein